jgi:hypothetical protein
MKLITKADLSMHDGLLLGPDNSVLSCPDLVDEVNELVDLAELITFVKTNASAIEAKADGFAVKFTPTKAKRAVITSGEDKPATPLKEEAEAAAVARANEFLDVQKFDDIEQNLERYTNIAQFLDKDYILVDSEGDDYCLTRFKTSPLLLTEAFVIATVKEYHEPAIRKLISNVVIGR